MVVVTRVIMETKYFYLDREKIKSVTLLVIILPWFYKTVLSNYIPSSELFCKINISNSDSFEDIVVVVFSPFKLLF